MKELQTIYGILRYYFFLKPRYFIYKRYKGNDELHKSLKFDADLYYFLTPDEARQYNSDLLKRRSKFHETNT